MFRRLLESPALAAADLSRVRLAVSGAAPCPWELAEQCASVRGIRIVRGYGMTELSGQSPIWPVRPTESPEAIGARSRSRGQDVDDTGRAFAAGEVASSGSRVPAAMQATRTILRDARSLAPGGWFRTGEPGDDVRGRRGADRRTHARADPGAGHRSSPRRWRRFLLTHPEVVEAAVVGVPHPTLGEEVHAFVALRPGAGAKADELVRYCRERLAAFKYPRQVTIVDALPRSATGKILKASLPRPTLSAPNRGS